MYAGGRGLGGAQKGYVWWGMEALQLTDPLLDLVPDGQVRAHKRLLVDVDTHLVVWPWPGDSRSNSCGICVQDDPTRTPND